MKKLICLAALALCGCASTAPGVTVTKIYSPPIIGQKIGDVIRVHDSLTGATFYYVVGSGGAVQLKEAK